MRICIRLEETNLETGFQWLPFNYNITSRTGKTMGEGACSFFFSSSQLLLKFKKFSFFIRGFLCLRTEGAGGNMFPGCPSGFFRLRDNSSIT